MALVIIPILMSMLLGRSIDLRTYIVGEDVFDGTNYVETPLHTRTTTFHVVQDSKFPFSYVGLPIDIVLRIKSGSLSTSIDVLGLDGFIRASSWRADSVVVAVTTMVKTVRRELKADAPQQSGWQTRVDHQQTHYAQAITYGGWSAIMYHYKCDNLQDREIVKRMLTEKLGRTGTLEMSTIELWNEAEKEMRASKEITGTVLGHVDAYSSIGRSKFVNNPDDIFSTIHKFEEDVGKVGGALYAELKPLHDLDSAYPVVEPDPKANAELEKVNEVYDDLRDAKLAIQHWRSQPGIDVSKEDGIIALTKISDYTSQIMEHINTSLPVFHFLASEASIYKPQNSSLLKAALQSYSAKLLTPDQPTYQQLLLQMTGDPECENNFNEEVEGVLNVEENDKIELGKVNGGLEECKAICFRKKKCRAIGYVDEFLAKENTNDMMVKILGDGVKHKQCTIYFRSTKTAKTVNPRPLSLEKNYLIFDRICH